MGIINKKGKLFGKINIVDLTIIIAILFILIFGIRILFFKEKQWIYVQMQLCVDHPYPTVTQLVDCGNVPYYFAEGISIGDVMVDFRGNIIAEVLGFDVYPSSKKGRLVVITSVLQTEDRSEIENNRNILVKVRLLAEIKNGGTEFRNNEVKVGTQMELETNGTALKGIIRKIGFSQEDIKEKLVKKTVGVKMYLQMPVIANSIIIGSTESSNEGKVMAKILDKKVEPAKIVAISDLGEVFKRDNPVYKDITLKVILLAEDRDNNYFFHDKELMIGEDIGLNVNETRIIGKIIDIN